MSSGGDDGTYGAITQVVALLDTRWSGVIIATLLDGPAPSPGWSGWCPA